MFIAFSTSAMTGRVVPYFLFKVAIATLLLSKHYHALFVHLPIPVTLHLTDSVLNGFVCCFNYEIHHSGKSSWLIKAHQHYCRFE